MKPFAKLSSRVSFGEIIHHSCQKLIQFNQMNMNVLKNFLVLTIPLVCSVCANVPGLMNSDQPDYELFYESLAAEYSDNLYSSTTEWVYVPSTTPSYEEIDEELDEGDNFDEATKKTTTTAPESYEAAISRLKCDNPWFWNTWKCVWLDLRNGKGGLERTKKNAKVAGILTGVISLFTICPICCTLVAFCFHRRLTKTYGRLIEKYMAEYVPGMIKLPNGKIEHYEPTLEEEEALMDLVKALTSVV